MTIAKYTQYIFLIITCTFFTDFAVFASDKDFTVVIDAGHGGKDTGAVENNVREKEVNLGVALKLAKILKDKNKNIKVVLTRDKDVFLTLQERADIANKAKADLFISIHTNSLDLKNPNRKTIEGASTYTLGLQKDKNNMDVARRENSVIAYESEYNTKYSGFDPNSDESYIIFEMAQKANMSQSVKFAEAVQKQLVNVAGRKDRGVKQAGFWVLWATSMPSVLVELDFVTNPSVAEFISSDGGQKKLATAIANATLAYFKNLETERINGSKIKNSSAQQVANSNEDVVLASAENSASGKKSATPSATNYKKGNQEVATARRRRSDKARELSENRQYEVAVINDERDYIVDSHDTTFQEESNQSINEVNTAISNNKIKTKEKAKKEPNNKKNSNRVVNGKTVQVNTTASSQNVKTSTSDGVVKKNKYTEFATNSNSADKQTHKDTKDKENPTTHKNKQTSSSKDSNKKNSPSSGNGVRLEKRKVVYRIQILASEEHLKPNNPRFCGLTPINCTKVGNLYKYTYGETTNKAEIDRMLVSVKKKIPDAFVVSQTK